MSAKASDAELRHSAVDRLKASFNTISTRKLVKTNFTSHTLPDNAEARVAVACSQLPESLDLGRANTNPVVYNPSKMKLCLLWKPDNPEVNHEEQCYGGKKNTGPSLLQSTSNPSLLLAIWLMKYITNSLVCRQWEMVQHSQRTREYWRKKPCFSPSLMFLGSIPVHTLYQYVVVMDSSFLCHNQERRSLATDPVVRGLQDSRTEPKC